MKDERNNLTKNEALELMSRGEKITHNFFSKEEWITMTNGKVETEDGYFMYVHLFFDIRQGEDWETGYGIFKEEK